MSAKNVIFLCIYPPPPPPPFTGPVQKWCFKFREASIKYIFLVAGLIKPEYGAGEGGGNGPVSKKNKKKISISVETILAQQHDDIFPSVSHSSF